MKHKWHINYIPRSSTSFVFCNLFVFLVLIIWNLTIFGGHWTSPSPELEPQLTDLKFWFLLGTQTHCLHSDGQVRDVAKWQISHISINYTVSMCCYFFPYFPVFPHLSLSWELSHSHTFFQLYILSHPMSPPYFCLQIIPIVNPIPAYP